MNQITSWLKKMKQRFFPERRLFPRCEITETDQIKAFFSLEGTNAYLHNRDALERPHHVINLSKGGASLFLLEEEDVEFYKTHNEINLKLVIEGVMLNIPCEVIYVLEGIRRIGLKFIEVKEQQLAVISKFLDVRFLAGAMKEIPIKKQPAKDSVCRWFHGMNNTDLFSWQDDRGNIYRHMLIFDNYIVEWTKSEGLRTGKVRRPDFVLTQTTLFSQEPNPIDFDETRNSESIKAAGSIIGLTDIDPPLKEHLLGHLS